ncbi:universal stress protein [Dyadobacter sp. CY345]|uniref:universal stress protein n=1 Tax=Dyadobacter sp. CY345 TaxID=2909335 RepID=UPI001F234335|nr:universal stress protein [Dyadobacter sp. CY345]MCF2444090.1 universal stress protein [Dyadobacter sp. CY345]
MKRILVPCNFSSQVETAFKFALEIAAVREAQIIVLTVLKEFDSNKLNEAENLKFQITENENRFKILLEKQAMNRVKVTHLLRSGKITPLILSIIDEEEIDLVIMGTHGSRGWDEFFMGSNIEKIVRTSPVPVFAVKNSTSIRSVHNIVFPVSLNPGNGSLVEKVKDLQKLFRARIHLLRINTGTSKKDSGTLQKLAEFAERNTLSNFTVNVRSSEDVKHGIIDFAREINADMITMATHGNRDLNHLYAPSIAADVVNHAGLLIWTCCTSKVARTVQKVI